MFQRTQTDSSLPPTTQFSLDTMPVLHNGDKYWVWHGMFNSYKSLRQDTTQTTDRKRLFYLKKQIVWHFFKNFFLYPIWFVRLLIPSYMKGRVNVWTNLKTILATKEFRPLRLAVLSQVVFLFFLAQFGVTVFYKNATPTFAATYHWVTTDWSGGASTSTFGSHLYDQTGWNTYFSKDSNIQTSVAGEVSVLGSSVAYTQTTDADFGSGTLEHMYVPSGSNSISLLKNNGASCTTDSECESGICNQYTNLCSNDNLNYSVPIATTTFNYNGSIQTYTVPTGVTSITIDTYGASGGYSDDGAGGNTRPGKGARMKGTFTVTPGQVLKILVGGQGTQAEGAGSGNRAGGGGGGTFVTDINNIPLIVAGGGGGENWASFNVNGVDAVTTNTGTGGGSTAGRGGGGGFVSNGTSYASGGGTGGNSFVNGSAGGAGSYGQGGYGGGGAQYEGGGGGGYNGGGVITTNAYDGTSPLAAGSYNIGTNQSNTAGYQTGNGTVILSSGDGSGVSSSPSEPSGGSDTTETFSYTGSMQTFVVPNGVTSLTIQAKGAQGGTSGGSVAGGLGADITGTVSVTPGETLKILVGGQGGSGNQGGGGGGSFVTTNANNPLVIAGGGGGGNYSSSYSYGIAYAKGSISQSGNPGVKGYGSVIGGAGGTSGNGGGCSPQFTSSEGSGGGGLIGNGSNCYGTTGGRSFVNGGAGGAKAGLGGDGGFGGGGGGDWSSWTGGGGGGGYSGGGGGTYYGVGGGGGSYNAGTNQTNVAGTNTGNGQVLISYISALPPTVTSVVISTSSIQMNWDAVADISFYTVSSTAGSTVTTTDTSYTFTGVATNTIYYFQVATDQSAFSSVTSTEINSGTYISSIEDATASAQFGIISWNNTAASGSILAMDIRTGDQPDLSDGVWVGVQNGDTLGANVDGKRYFQYRITLATNNEDTLPSVEDVTINYDINTGTFISSPYDTGNDGNLLGSLAWSATTGVGDVIAFQLRTSADGSTWTDWMGTGGTSATYFTDADGLDAMPSVLGDGENDRWVQYKVFLTDDGTSGLVLSDVTITYVVNERPEVQNVTAVQNADGTVSISYEVRDIDSMSGATPGTILPTIEYWNGGSWVEATSLSTGALSAKAVHTDDVNLYTEYSLTWYPNEDYDEQYLDENTGKIRVKANDSEAASNIGIAESPTFGLDTKAPVQTSFVIDGRSDTEMNLTLSATDDTMSGMLIKLSQASSLAPDGTNELSGVWLAYDTQFDWSLNTNPSTVYYQFQDATGNTSTVYSTSAPEIPQHLVYRDISNAETSEWREFIVWETVSNPSVGFKQYNIYRKMDAGTFELVDTQTNRSINYYIDTALNTDITYSYKITAEDNADNISNYSVVVTDAPDGQGGSDFTSPTISQVVSSNVGPQTATITWDTDELANSTVEYISVEGGNFSNADSIGIATMLDTSAGLGQHQVVLTGLLPDTTYYYQVKSTDPNGNMATEKADVNGYSFSTLSGPRISSVSVSNIGNRNATVTWQTDIASNAYVYVSTSTSFSSYERIGTASESTSHVIPLTDLTPNTQYYYYVMSGGTADKHVIDGEITYYNFITTNASVAPLITFASSQDITNLSDTGVTIAWSTNHATTSTLEYGTDSSFGTVYANAYYNMNHRVTLSDLTLGTSYYVRLLNTDANGNTSIPTEFVFTTTDSTDLTAPEMSAVTTTLVSDTKAVITWTTDEGSSSQVLYGTSAESLLSETILDTASNRSHTVVISGLTPRTQYYYRVKSADANGNTTTSTPVQSFTTLQELSEEDAIIAREALSYQQGYDTAPTGGGGGILIVDDSSDRIAPVLAEVTVTDISDSNAIFRWTANEKSDGIVEYSSLEGRYDMSAIDTPLVDNVSHSVHVYDLSPLTTYYYRVSSEDANNNRSEYHTGSFTTGRVNADGSVILGESNSLLDALDGQDATAEETYLASLERASAIMQDLSGKVSSEVMESTLLKQSSVISELAKSLPPPVISNQTVAELGSSYVTLSWLTDKETNSLVDISSEESYSKTGEYEQTIGDSISNVISHVVTIRGLRPNTLYHYRLISRTQTGVEATTRDITFRTTAETSEIITYKSEEVSSSETMFSWMTNVPTDSTISYTPYTNGVPNLDAKQIVHSNEYTNDHSLNINGLEAGVVYDIELSGQDYSNNTVTKLIQGYTIDGEDLSPIVYQIQTESSILPGANDKIQVIISWMTNELSTSRVLYRKGFSAENEEFTESTSLDQNYIRKHIVVVTNFEPGAVYQFQVESTDSAGNTTRSKTMTVLTPRKQESVFQVIMGNFQDIFSWVGKVQN